MSGLGQRTGIKFLWKEGCFAKIIHDRLQAVSGDGAYALPSVYLGIKEFKGGREDIVDQPRSEGPPINNLDADILYVLRHGHSIAKEAGVSFETVLRRLMESLERQPRFLKWLLPLLTCDLKGKRVEVSEELL
jgi:hypothetical protein